MRSLIVVAGLVAVVGGHEHKQEEKYPGELKPLPGLKRVVVLARHGNRAPNPQVEMLCPPYAKEILPKFGVAPAQPSRVGMAENHESGTFLREHYKDFLPEGPIPYDSTFTFFSERAPRNIVSTYALAQGIFPEGTGLPGYSKISENYVPIATTQEGFDMLMNCPRDGPCQPNLKADLHAYVAAHEAKMYADNKELFAKVSKACNFELSDKGLTYQGKHKTLIWAAKGIMDAFTFAQTEGLDATMGGRIDMKTIKEFHDLVDGMLEVANFGMPRQLTYWAADFIPTFLSLGEYPLVKAGTKLSVWLNHRELIYSTARVLKIPINFPGQREGSLPTGCTLSMEVYEEGVRLFYWMPTRTTWKEKAEYLKEGKPIQELYPHGVLLPTAAAGCEAGKLCKVDVMQKTFLEHIAQTGTWADICGVPKKFLQFSPKERSLGIEAPWITRSSPNLQLFAESKAEEATEGGLDWRAIGMAGALSLATAFLGWKIGKTSASAASAREGLLISALG